MRIARWQRSRSCWGWSLRGRRMAMSGMTSDRLEELRRIAEAATPGPEEIITPSHPVFDSTTVLVLLDEIERLRREREAALDILSREDIGDGAKVEGLRLILKSGDRGGPTRESERARLVAEVGECCRGADPMCAAGCLVEAALRQRLVDVEEMLGLAFEGEE